MILEWEIKDAKMSGFSFDFQTLIVFSIWIINEFGRCVMKTEILHQTG